MTNPYGPPSGPQPQQPYGPPSGPQPQQPYGQPQQPYGPPSGPQPQQQYGPPQGAPPPYPGQPQPGQPQPGQPQPPGALAEWGTRALGYLIDGGIMVAVMLVLYLIIGAVGGGIFAGSDTTGELPPGFWIFIVIGVLGYLAIFAFAIWNTAYRRGTTGQTLGQKYMNIKTVSEATGRPIGFGYAFLRQIVHVVDSIICGLPIGWLAPTWDEKRQTWADKIMSTVVVRVDGSGGTPPGQLPGAPGMPPAPGQPPQGGFGQPPAPGMLPAPGQPPQGGFGQPPAPGQPPQQPGYGQPPQQW